jgi:NDP-sugar pyrophosphorylase family protein
VVDRRSNAIEPSRIPVFVLSGGLGTRLQDVWSGPKALVPVEGRPFIAHLLDEIEAGGFRRIVLLTGHGADAMEEALRDRDVTLLREGRPLGTAGALRAASPMAAAWNVILNGDSICQVPWDDLLAFSVRGPVQETGGRETASPFRVVLVAAKMDDAEGFGTLSVDPQGYVTEFREKRDRGSALVNAGIYVACGEFFREELSEEAGEDPLSLEQDILPLLARRRTLGAWVTGERFWDIGTPDRLTAFAASLRARSRKGGSRR